MALVVDELKKKQAEIGLRQHRFNWYAAIVPCVSPASN